MFCLRDDVVLNPGLQKHHRSHELAAGLSVGTTGIHEATVVHTCNLDDDIFHHLVPLDAVGREARRALQLLVARDELVQAHKSLLEVEAGGELPSDGRLAEGWLGGMFPTRAKMLSLSPLVSLCLIPPSHSPLLLPPCTHLLLFTCTHKATSLESRSCSCGRSISRSTRSGGKLISRTAMQTPTTPSIGPGPLESNKNKNNTNKNNKNNNSANINHPLDRPTCFHDMHVHARQTLVCMVMIRAHALCVLARPSPIPAPTPRLSAATLSEA